MNGKITLFHPYVPDSAKKAVRQTLNTRWIGQGPRVEEFEKLWEKKISSPHKAVAVNSCTSALHLAYILAGIRESDEVVAPIFTFPSTNIPILYQRARVVFADVKKDSLNIDPNDIARKITSKTKAIVVVHYGGLPCDMDKIQEISNHHRLPVIEDAAHATGVDYSGQKIGSISDFTCFSFQAVKVLNTATGGMLTLKDNSLVERAKALRWLGARKSKSDGRWAKGIPEIGFRYETTDVAASMGIAALKELGKTKKHYQELSHTYKENLADIPGVTYIGGIFLCVILTQNRDRIRHSLTKHGIESGLVDVRNDRFSIFGRRVNLCPHMDELENKYLMLPTHYFLNKKNVEFICQIIRKTLK
jgi:dTDP-4-amino-4,6-dideoxygalactose transaminase